MQSSKDQRGEKEKGKLASRRKITKFAEANKVDVAKSAIQNVRNMKYTPPVYVYTIKRNKNTSLYSVDFSRDYGYIAGTFKEERDIFIKVKPKTKLPESEDTLQNNLNRLLTRDEKNDVMLNFLYDVPEQYLLGHELPVTGIRCVPKEQLLLSCSLDRTVRAWNTENLKEKQIYKDIAVQEHYCDLDVSRNTPYFATSGIRGTVSLYSLEHNYPVKNFHGHRTESKCVRFHPNSLYLAVTSENNTIKLLNIQSGSTARIFQDDKPTRTLAFSPDGQYLASYSGGQIKMWDLAQGTLLKTFLDSKQDSLYHNLCFSAFNNVLASGGIGKKVNLWDVSTLPKDKEESEILLLKIHSFTRRIAYLKFDENNIFTCVTA